MKHELVYDPQTGEPAIEPIEDRGEVAMIGMNPPEGTPMPRRAVCNCEGGPYHDNQGRCHNCGASADLSSACKLLRLARDIERLGPMQGIDLDHETAAWRSRSGYSLKRRGQSEEHRTAAEVVLAWLEGAG